jgi:hypothetical protein
MELHYLCHLRHDTYLSLREEDAPFPALRERELHRLRVAGHATRGQARHVPHVHIHAGRC